MSTTARQTTGAELAAEELLAHWCRAVCARDVAAAVDCYADEAVLHPTFQSGWQQGREPIAGYFTAIGQRDALAVEVHRCTIETLAPTVAQLDGHYTFSWQEDGRDVASLARFSMTMAQQADGAWRIVSHHSSSMPQ